MAASGTIDEKRSIMLLEAIIFHYHGLDEEEETILSRTARELDAHEELKWAYDFIATDYISAFDRAREYMNTMVDNIDKPTRLRFMNATWRANFEKGYITEMEATAMLKIARDWEVDSDLIAMVQSS